MIHYCRYPVRQTGTVTSLAHNARNRDVPHRHSGLRRGINAAVTSDARSGDHYRVIHRRRFEGTVIFMTGIAAGGSNNVSCRFTQPFAGRGLMSTIVTGGTGGGDHNVMDHQRGNPAGGVMASVARHTDRNVSGRFESRSNATTNMTTRALGRCAQENCVDMAGFASRDDVSTGQRETGSEVVEGSCIPRRRP